MAKILSLLLVLLIGVGLYAQEVIYETYEAGIDLWVLIPYSTFIFPKSSNHADYQISIQLKNSLGKQVLNYESGVTVPNRLWLQGTALPVFLHKKLETGTHTAIITLRNKDLGDKRSFKKSFPVSDQATEIGQAYILAQREGYTYIPKDLSTDQLEQLTLKQSFSIIADSLRVKTDNKQEVLHYPASPINLDLLKIAYENQISELKISYFENNIQYNLEPFLYSEWFSYGLRYTLKEQLEQIRYIASQNEWKALKNLAEDKIAEAIESFWSAKDPSPGTIRNEAREEFYKRVINADEMYTIHKKMKGWASDRGRIYIKYGQPDEVITDAFPIGKAPSITWVYYQKNLEFVFADIRGFGQYILRNKDEEY